MMSNWLYYNFIYNEAGFIVLYPFPVGFSAFAANTLLLRAEFEPWPKAIDDFLLFSCFACLSVLTS